MADPALSQLASWPRRNSVALRHAGKFAAAGVLNTAIYYGTYLLLRSVLYYLLAHLLAILVSMVFSFFINSLWTFRTRPTWRKFALWPLTNLVNYVITTVGVVFLVQRVGMDQRIAPLVAAAVAIPVTFLLSRRLLMGRTGAAAGHPASLPDGASGEY
jgi:putative flippase GtrA